MVDSANTINDITKIKESLGQEVVPSVTGKPSRILKDQHPRHNIKKVTAAGASLFEIAGAINANPTLTVEQAIKQGKQERQTGSFRRGTQSFFRSALGHGLGDAIVGIFDTKAQKDQKKLTEVERKYEEGNKFKANFLKSLLGEKVGGLIARASTLTSTKTAAFEKYQELTKSLQDKNSANKVTVGKRVTRAPTKVKPTSVKPRSTPEREEAHKALMALGFKKEEANDRLANAPENASVEELIKHGLNPTVKPISRPEAAGAARTQLQQTAAQQEADETAKEEDEKNAIKKQQEHNKKVEEDLSKILKKLDSKDTNSLFGMLLGALAKALSKTFDKVWNFLTSIGTKLAKLFPKILQALGSIGKGIAQIGGKSLKWLSDALEGLGLGDVIAAGGAVAITGAAVYGSQKLIDRTLINARKQLDKPLKKYGLETDHQHFGYFKLNGKEVAADDLPDIYKNLVYSQYTPQQMSIGKINEAKQYLQTHQAELKALEVKPTTSPTKVIAKAPTITPKNVADVSQHHSTTKKENDDLDFMGAFQDAMAQMGMPTTTDIATLKGVNEIKSLLPAFAKTNDSDPGGVIVKLRNDESSQASYVAQIFDHPATAAGPGIM